MAENETAKWYVVHTYSGYENKVKANMEKTIENRGMEALIPEIKVPMQEIVKVDSRTNKPVTKQEKLYPGYVMVKMVMTDETWYIVRNTRGVTGFVGPGSKPEPLSDEEVVMMGVERIALKVDLEPGDNVKILSGALENFVGTVEEVYPDRQKVKLNVSMFGRETPVELDFIEVRKT
ncbi:MAG: transcription termination/antitermination protein NusG [Eubacteriales bacterium]|nr:transcription termination/antitermination protein NusG [Eubacteriales bacterium]